MALEIRDPATGQIKGWVWIALGIVGVAIFFLISRLGGSADSGSAAPAPNVTGGQSSDITDYLNQLEQNLQDIAGNSNVPVTTGSPPAPNPTNPQQLQDIIDQLKQGNQVLEQAQQNLLSLLGQQSDLQQQYSTAEAKRSQLITNRETAQRNLADLKLRYKDKKITKATYDKWTKIWTGRLNTANTQITAVDKTIAGINSALANIKQQITNLNQSLA